MAIQIKDPNTVAGKWATRAGAAQADYKAGVMAPRRPQNASAIAAAPLWASAVADAATRDAFAKGLRKAGEDKYRNNASTKGAAHYPDGVRVAQPAYAAGVQPYFAALASATLPPRGLRRSPQNLQRVQFVDNLLASIKTGKP